MINRKVKEEVITKEDDSHEIKLKKAPKKAENKYCVFNCFLYVNKKRVDYREVKWYIADKPEHVFTNMSEIGTFVIDIAGLRSKNGSVTIVAKYKDKQYYHTFKRWKDKNKRKILALGLGVGLGVPAFAGAITGIILAVTKNRAARTDQGEVKFTSWDQLIGFANTGQFKKPDTWEGIKVDGRKPYDETTNKSALKADEGISIAKFMEDELSAGVIAEGIISNSKEEGFINDDVKTNFDLNEANVNWDTTTDKVTAGFSIKMTEKDSNATPVEESVSYTFEKEVKTNLLK